MTIGVLLTNLGTPDAPTSKAVRQYLAEFLMDPNVIQLPALLRGILVYGFILPFRAKRSAELYKKIWLPDGSPLRVISYRQAAKLQQQLGNRYKVMFGMRYGEPSLESALLAFKKLNIAQVLVLPLYPQHSISTTGSTFHKIDEIIRDNNLTFTLKKLSEYYHECEYINAIANTLKNDPAQKILFSFHGLPQKFIDDGDVYLEHCKKTVELVTEKLSLAKNQFGLSFQSRLGKTPWIKPYTDQLLQQWAKQGVESVSVVCPGFSVDCLETLEEINIQNRELFLSSGGKVFNYIPALNDSDAHIAMMSSLVEKNTEHWL